jgi:hypothetical protein
MPQARELIFAGKYKEAEDLSTLRCVVTRRTGELPAIGDVLLNFHQAK